MIMIMIFAVASPLRLDISRSSGEFESHLAFVSQSPMSQQSHEYPHILQLQVQALSTSPLLAGLISSVVPQTTLAAQVQAARRANNSIPEEGTRLAFPADSICYIDNSQRDTV